MKKLLFAVAAILAAGCSLEENFQRLERVEKEITIKAVREGDEAETRTFRQDSDGSVWWVPGDAISLFYGSGTDGGSKFTSVNTSDTTKVTNFTGVITAITGGGEIDMDQTYFWGFYPYQEDASCDGTGVTMTLPTKQTAVPGTFATNTFPSIGRSQGLVMGFYNICGGMKFSVTKEGIKRITLKSKGGEYVSGKAKVSFGEDGIPAAEIIDGSDEVVLEAPAGEYFIPGKFYFMVMFPTTFSQGFTVKFETFTEEASVEKGKVTVKRSIFGKISNLDGSATYSKKTGNIPVEDANFKAYLVENFDGNGDGEISYEEAAAILKIDTRTTDIESVQGIEFMINLVCLNISNKIGGASIVQDPEGYWYYDYRDSNSRGNVSAIDISNNQLLDTLNCAYNKLTSIDISNNSGLSLLHCSFNEITSLDLSNNLSLVKLICSNNKLSTLDISNNIQLTTIGCGFNRLQDLDFSQNIYLEVIGCYYNKLVSIDVTKNTRLRYLECFNNLIENLDVTNNTALYSLCCHDLLLNSLDLSNNKSLKFLYCEENKLSALDVSNNSALRSLRCFSNLLTNLDVSNNTDLDELSCSNNQLTNLEITKNPALRLLDCDRNQLTNLDVSKNAKLQSLRCYSNLLTYLDVSKNTALTSLDCSPMDVDGVNQLTTLYISPGQEIPNITTDRNSSYIHSETQIVVKPSDGGGEGTGEENW